MKTWYKYQLNYKDKARFFPKDSSFEDHKRSMQGYDSAEGYGSKEDFFKTHLYNAHPRHRYYHDYLMTHLERSGSMLSIGSGRCANELLLMDAGFNIICSDLEQPCREETMRLFPRLRFVKYDVTQGPVPGNFDTVISLSMFYLFNDKQLAAVFKNVAGGLRPGGSFILDPGGAEDNIGTRIIDDLLCPVEARSIRVLQRILKKKECVVAKKHQGYRRTDAEIVSIAGKAGFRVSDTKKHDYFTEFGMRSVFFGKMPRRVVEFLGKAVPYLRIFSFRKEG